LVPYVFPPATIAMSRSGFSSPCGVVQASALIVLIPVAAAK
jgi:hypothetical protein